MERYRGAMTPLRVGLGGLPPAQFFSPFVAFLNSLGAFFSDSYLLSRCPPLPS